MEEPYLGMRDSRNNMTYKEILSVGRALRNVCPRKKQADWKAPTNRQTPIDMVLASDKGRLQELLPLRHGRMVRSAFTFYRGSALTMAADLSSTPSTGIWVQCCGDAHLCNFSGFATAERKVVFSVNELDETLPAPWEWDVKRLAASFVVACRDQKIGDSSAKEIATSCARSYRESMIEFSQMKTLELWYRALEPKELLAMCSPQLRKRIIKRIEQEQAKSRAEELFPKLVEDKGEKPMIKDVLPIIFHNKDNPPGKIHQIVRSALASYRDTLPTAYQSLLSRYEIRDAVIKVVGIGGVGTSCWVLLLMAANDDPLFLQVKEARASVLESYAGASVFPDHGQRIVNGYRIMQPAGDMFLGWTRGVKRDFFVRQLRDVKISARVETFGRAEMEVYANWCGRAMALSHARSGTSAILSGYMGNSDEFDLAIGAFSVAYADQNEKDHECLDRAVRIGRIKAVFEERC